MMINYYAQMNVTIAISKSFKIKYYTGLEYASFGVEKNQHHTEYFPFFLLILFCRSTDVTSTDLVSAKGKTKEAYCCDIVVLPTVDQLSS